MKSGDTDAHTGVKFLAYVASILIIVINIILGIVIDIIAKYKIILLLDLKDTQPRQDII